MTFFSLSVVYFFPVMMIELPYAELAAISIWTLTLIVWYGVFIGYRMRSAAKQDREPSSGEAMRV